MSPTPVALTSDRISRFTWRGRGRAGAACGEPSPSRLTPSRISLPRRHRWLQAHAVSEEEPLDLCAMNSASSSIDEVDARVGGAQYEIREGDGRDIRRRSACREHQLVSGGQLAEGGGARVLRQ